MLTAEWNRIWKTNRRTYTEKYHEFFADPDNEGNCENCPDNLGEHAAWLKPCNRHECKVKLTAQAAKEKKEFIFGK